ncbi:MAG: succinate dehydrogenase/fumarate reductase iron-sulfur subunit [Bacteroidales bacterium]|nr:succinate dehydrogenase/fumarate reductase iron-sulfur subunit [Bacteroidales bacterium]MDZ4203331.1 succinate dehydrogenase/fumarate reductase iron-sulfur subunit [Bacteroidales bacterium]
MKIKLKIWRQKNAKAKGRFADYELANISSEMGFLEMIDALNTKLIGEKKEPVSFDHDCREGICGSCGLYINGRPHGPDARTTTCELRMRSFKDGETVVIEPWRAKSFPVIKDLVVDRTALDHIIAAGGYISVDTGAAQEANNIAVCKNASDKAFDAASCIGCGACVASCKNSSAMLFVSAKVYQLAMLPQGKIEARERVQKMTAEMDRQGFGSCSNTYACEAECPKGISVTTIARMNAEFLTAKIIAQKVG